MKFVTFLIFIILLFLHFFISAQSQIDVENRNSSLDPVINVMASSGGAATSIIGVNVVADYQAFNGEVFKQYGIGGKFVGGQYGLLAEATRNSGVSSESNFGIGINTKSIWNYGLYANSINETGAFVKGQKFSLELGPSLDFGTDQCVITSVITHPSSDILIQSLDDFTIELDANEDENTLGVNGHGVFEIIGGVEGSLFRELKMVRLKSLMEH